MHIGRHLVDISTLAIVNNAATSMQLFSFYSCKERSLLNWITQRLITGGRNCPTQDATLLITANTVAATAPEGSSHPQSPQPSPEVLSSTTPVHQFQKWPSCQLPVSHPFPFPKRLFWFSANFIWTLCHICLDGMWAPLRIPLPQILSCGAISCHTPGPGRRKWIPFFCNTASN